MRLVLILFVTVLSTAGQVPPGNHRVRGVVTDESGAVLPGVTVVAAGADARALETTVTYGAGRYALGPLAGARITLGFQLEGFSPVTQAVTLGDTETIANQQMAIAPQSETVMVVGKIPVPPPAPPPPPPPAPIRARPFTFPVADHALDSVCGPAKLESAPESMGTIQSRRAAANGLYGPGDELTIDGGMTSGLRVGRNLVVRRTYQASRENRDVLGEHTSGLVQIVAVQLDRALAVVIYACDEMLPGDRLASFHPEPRRAPLPAGKPDYRRAAKILFSDIGQIVGSPRRMMVIDQGASSKVVVGQLVTLFRRRARDGQVSVIGDAVVVAVRTNSATIRVDQSRDAIFDGDWAALQR